MPEAGVINPAEQKDWNELVLRTPASSFFHTSSWAEALCRSYGYRPFYFAIKDGDALSALLPVMEVDSFLTGKRGVSLPFTDYCEPIVSDAAQFQELFAEAVAFGKKQNWRYLELRGGGRFFINEEPSEWHYGHTLDLTQGPQQLFAALRDSNRRNINKAEKEKIAVTVAASPDVLKAFCRLNALTRRDHGLPPQPRRFFQYVYDRILSQSLGFIAMASVRGTALAANVYFHFGDQLIYKYGASDKRHQHLRANNLIMWKAMEWGCEHGYQSLCFGRTEPGNEGLRQFKAGWGTREYIIKYYRYDLQKDAFVKSPAVVKPAYRQIFRNLPIPILNMLGNILYRHMG